MNGYEKMRIEHQECVDMTNTELEAYLSLGCPDDYNLDSYAGKCCDITCFGCTIQALEKEYPQKGQASDSNDLEASQ